MYNCREEYVEQEGREHAPSCNVHLVWSIFVVTSRFVSVVVLGMWSSCGHPMPDVG